MFSKKPEDTNNVYYKFITSDDKVIYGHYRKNPEWLLHEYFTGVSMSPKLRGMYLEFDPKPFNGPKTELKLRQYDGKRILSTKEFEKILKGIDEDKKRVSMKKLLGIKEIEEDPSINESDIKYCIFNSEIGEICCYQLGYNEYEEFFTSYKCHTVGTTLVFDYCDTGFDVKHESFSGNDTLAVKKVNKEKFAREIDAKVKYYGSEEAVKQYIIKELNKVIKIRNENLAKYRIEREQARATKISEQEASKEMIKKYGIR